MHPTATAVFPDGFVTAVSPSLTTILYHAEKNFLIVFVQATQRCQTASQLTGLHCFSYISKFVVK